MAMDYLLQDLVLLSCEDIKDPPQLGAPEVVKSCQETSATVRKAVRDDLQTAKPLRNSVAFCPMQRMILPCKVLSSEL